MRSFDFYDTLFVRPLGRPSDVFRIIETRLAIPGFAAWREASEQEARRLAGPREVTLPEIYATAAPPGCEVHAAMCMEVDLELSLVVPVQRLLAQVQRGDIVVSDMYLSGSVLRDILARYFTAPAPDLVVSSEQGRSKSRGHLWAQLRESHPQLNHHYGDNRHADVRQARRHGLRATWVQDTRFNDPERAWLARKGLDASIVAGLSRATRLAAAEQEQAMAEPFASVFAPALVGFVEHVLATCAERGIQRLLFQARDGQLPWRIAQRIASARGLDLDIRYVHASRHALHLAAFTDIEQALPWLLEDTTNLTLRDVAGRGEWALEDVLAAAATQGWTEPDRDIPRSERYRLREVLRHRKLVDDIQARARKRCDLALRYFARQGCTPGARVALVDVGWTGRMQRSLRVILDSGGGPPVEVHGIYFGLVARQATDQHDHLDGYLHDPVRDVEPCPLTEYRAVIEAAMMADHGTTLGYAESVELGVVPTLAPVPQEDVQTARLQQSVVLRFVDQMLAVETAMGRALHWPHASMSHQVLRLLRKPSHAEALAFAGQSHRAGQADAQADRLVVRLPLGGQLLRWRTLGLWPEGTYRLSGCGALLPALQAARALKAWLRRR